MGSCQSMLDEEDESNNNHNTNGGNSSSKPLIRDKLKPLPVNYQARTEKIQNQINTEYQYINSAEKPKPENLKRQYSLEELQSNFYVITCVYSPIDNTKEKIAAYKNFAEEMHRQGIKLITIEYTSQGSPFIITEEFYEPYHIQIRVDDPLALKYNLVNQVLKRFSSSYFSDWTWVAVIDYNLELPENWQSLVIQQLQTYPVVQIFQSILTKDQFGDVLYAKDGLAKHLYDKESTNLEQLSIQYEFSKGWAYRRDFYDIFDGILDFFVVGYEELFMMLVLLGQCSSVCQPYLQKKIIDFIKEKEMEFKGRGVKIAYAQQELIAIDLGMPSSYTIQDAISHMTPILENIQKNDEGIFQTKNSEVKSRLSQLKSHLL